jgi:hypothetical protein
VWLGESEPFQDLLRSSSFSLWQKNDVANDWRVRVEFEATATNRLGNGHQPPHDTEPSFTTIALATATNRHMTLGHPSQQSPDKLLHV